MNQYTKFCNDFQEPGHEAVLTSSKRGELGNAELLALMYTGLILFDLDERLWYLWAGNCWVRDKAGELWNLIGNQLAGRYEQAAGIEQALSKSKNDEHTSNAESLRSLARSLRLHNYAKNIIHFGQSQPKLYAENSIWDNDPYLLACPNGVVDLKTGQLRPGKPDDYIRTVIPTSYLGLDEPAPRFEQFLAEIFDCDNEKIKFSQRLLGYGITGLSIEQIIPFLVGPGRNGKDTLVQIIEDTLGTELAGPVTSDVLLSSRQSPGAASPHIAGLRFKRLCYINETNDGLSLNAGQVKWLTGASTLTGRLLRENYITFKPQHLLLLITNHKPQAPADDYALWKRILLVEFDQSFVDNPQAPNEKPVDKNLSSKLRAESAGILAWLVRGCLSWQYEGLNPPESVTLATEQYRQGEDTLGQFIQEEFDLNPGHKTSSSLIYKYYKEWCETNGLRPLGIKRFAQKLKLKFETVRQADGVYYLGLAPNEILIPIVEGK